MQTAKQSNGRRLRTGQVIAAGLLAAVTSAGCGSGTDSGPTSTTTTGSVAQTDSPKVNLIGAGSTFVNPVMSKWIYEYQQKFPNVTINYQSVGSGAGISQYKAGTVDFGATDAPISPGDLAAMPTPTAQFPVAAGCEVLAYNVPGVTAPIKLTGDLIAGIYMGKILKWTDSKIAKENPGTTFPDLAITVAHRSDGSGTTYIFTNYLSAVSPEWKAKTGAGKSVNFPIGIGGKGNEGVAGLIKATPGVIGYVELAYAVQTKLTYGPLKNLAGQYIDASIDSATAALAASADALHKDPTVPVVNSADPKAYPITGMTYVLVPTSAKDPAKGKAINDFMKWAVTDGQALGKDLQYAPLPPAVAAVDLQALAPK